MNLQWSGGTAITWFYHKLQEWGADVGSLKQIYKYLIRARIEYGCLVYGSAAKSVSAELDIVQAKALIICTGAVRSSPVCSLQVEIGEMPFFFFEESSCRLIIGST